MNDDAFSLDTNILIYALDPKSDAKHAIAKGILDRSVERDCRLTFQSLSEFYAAVTRKDMLSRLEAMRQVEDWMLVFSLVPPTTGAIRSALGLAQVGRASYWDALLVATAAEGGCKFMVSEDMADGATLAGITILNPFDGERLSGSVAELLGQT